MNLRREGYTKVSGLAKKTPVRERALELYPMTNENTPEIDAGVALGHDRTGRLVFIDRGAAYLLGYDRDDLVGVALRDLVAGPALPLFDDYLDELARTPSKAVVVPLVGRSGEECAWASLNLYPENTQAGPLVVVGQLRADPRLIRNIHQKSGFEGGYRALFEISPIPACVFDVTSLSFLAVNDAGIKQYGYSREEFLSMTIREIPAEKDVERLSRLLKQPLPNELNAGDWTHARKDGSEIEVEMVWHPVTFEGRRAVLALAIDATERKLAEESLSRSEKLYRTLAENFPNCTIVLFDQQFRATVAQGASLAAVGMTKEMVQGRTMWELLPRETCEHLYPRLRDALAGETTSFELKLGQSVFAVNAMPVRNQRGDVYTGVLVAEDISSRKQIEEELRSSEARYRAFVEQSAEAIWRFETDQPISLTGTEDEVIARFFKLSYLAECNDAMAKMYGFNSAEEIVGMRIDSMLVPTEPQNVEYMRAFLRANLRLLDAESVEPDKDGVNHYFLNNLIGQFENGELVGAWGTQRDITELKLAHQRIKESEQLYRQMAFNASDVLYVITPGADTVDWYGQIDALVGYEEGEWPHTREMWLQSLHPVDRGRISDAFERSCLTGEPFSEEYRIRRKDGSYSYWTDRGTPIGAEDGSMLRFVGACSDITERRLAEEEVMRTRQQLKNLFDNLDQVFWSADPETGRYLQASSATEKVFGVSPEVLQQQQSLWAPQVLAADLPIVDGAMAKLQAGEGVTVQYRITRPDGQTRWVESNMKPALDTAGRVIRFDGTTADISERKRVEVELQRAKEAAEAASRAKSEFLANMSHEMRTPMNGIIGMTDLTLDTELTEDQREFLNMVKLSADSLLQVIGDVLDFSQIDGGRLELKNSGFNLRSSLDEDMVRMAALSDEKGLSLNCHIAEEVPDALIGDPVRLHQVLINLIGNAIKFTEAGKVVLQVERESQTVSDVVLRFAISDTGIGVSPDKVDLIFEAFTQADNSTTRKYGGTGLGLSISRQLVELMGGRLWVTSPSEIASIAEECEAQTGSERVEFSGGSRTKTANGKAGRIGPGSTFHFTLRLGLQEGVSGAGRS
jgi:PAS domain S-box-containing protein